MDQTNKAVRKHKWNVSELYYLTYFFLCERDLNQISLLLDIPAEEVRDMIEQLNLFEIFAWEPFCEKNECFFEKCAYVQDCPAKMAMEFIQSALMEKFLAYLYHKEEPLLKYEMEWNNLSFVDWREEQDAVLISRFLNGADGLTLEEVFDCDLHACCMRLLAVRFQDEYQAYRKKVNAFEA